MLRENKVSGQLLRVFVFHLFRAFFRFRSRFGALLPVEGSMLTSSDADCWHVNLLYPGSSLRTAEVCVASKRRFTYRRLHASKQVSTMPCLSVFARVAVVLENCGFVSKTHQLKALRTHGKHLFDLMVELPTPRAIGL